MRTLYGKFIEYDPTNVAAWVMFAELEGSLQEEDRARSLHELALSQPVLNQPEALWMHYIDYELSVGDRGAARALYERLLERTQHVKVRRRLTRCPTCHCPLLVMESGIVRTLHCCTQQQHLAVWVRLFELSPCSMHTQHLRDEALSPPTQLQSTWVCCFRDTHAASARPVGPGAACVCLVGATAYVQCVENDPLPGRH